MDHRKKILKQYFNLKNTNSTLAKQTHCLSIDSYGQFAIWAIFVFFLTSCSSINNSQIQGNYNSKKYNTVSFLYLKYLKNTSVTSGVRLQIELDSTYFLRFCGNYIQGTWKKTGDTLFLKCNQNIKIKDSTNLKCGDVPLKFHFNKNGELLMVEELELKSKQKAIKNSKIITHLIREKYQ
jgi:hypothetical protein